MANKLKERWAAGKATINGWLAIPSAISAEVIAQAGWDSLTVDLQHGLQDYVTAVACFQGVQLQGVTRLARVPWNEPGIVGKVLDAGAEGIICPMVNSVAEAEALVRACRYPPLGTRSFGPVRAGIYGARSPSFTEAANRDIICMPMIETQRALDDLAAILAVPGVDAVYIGPSDLGLSLGLAPRLDREEPEVLAILERIVREAGKHGKIAGIHCDSPSYAARAIAMGFRMTTVGSDLTHMLKSARAAVAQARAEAGDKV